MSESQRVKVGSSSGAAHPYSACSHLVRETRISAIPEAANVAAPPASLEAIAPPHSAHDQYDR